MIFPAFHETYLDGGFTLKRLGAGKQAAIIAASWRVRSLADLEK
jgi:hypothetical protein